MGVTLVPRLSVPASAIAENSAKKPKAKSQAEDALVVYRPITDDKRAQPPTRRVVLVWRKSFTRYEAIAALRNAIYACELPGVTRLS
jgi:LysR family transcriptional regulator, hydrogen peroxide-inducible genes activator